MYYYKLSWNCGFVGTDNEDIIESETEISSKELDEMVREYWYETCGEYYHEEVTEQDYNDYLNDL